MIHKLIIFIIKIYRSSFSLIFPPSCRFTPTCSQYAIDALNDKGVFLGIWMAIKRILKCHPFSKHKGCDPA